MMAAIATLLTACMADEVGGVYMITEEVDTLHAVADQKAEILFNAGGEWTAKSSESWLEAIPETGAGGRNIITIRSTEPNRTKQVRQALLTITSDGKSKTIQVVQRNEFALFDTNEYVVDPKGGEVVMSFTTNVPKGVLYISYLKYDWYSLDTLGRTRAEEWSGKVKPIKVSANETEEERSAKFVLGIYDDNKSFMVLDSTIIRQEGMLAP